MKLSISFISWLSTVWLWLSLYGNNSRSTYLLQQYFSFVSFRAAVRVEQQSSGVTSRVAGSGCTRWWGNSWTEDCPLTSESHFKGPEWEGIMGCFHPLLQSWRLHMLSSTCQRGNKYVQGFKTSAAEFELWTTNLVFISLVIEERVQKVEENIWM